MPSSSNRIPRARALFILACALFNLAVMVLLLFAGVRWRRLWDVGLVLNGLLAVLAAASLWSFRIRNKNT